MNKLLLIVATLCLCACASRSPYAEATGARDYGYSETRLTDNRYRISFRGNANTSQDEVKDMALLRASELTLLNDYDWFRVVDQDTDETGTATVFPSTSVGPAQRVYRDCGPLGCTTTVAPAYSGMQIVTVRELDRYTTSIEIVMGNGDLIDPTTAYDAAEIRSSLAGRY
jgi:hypothetical protein